MTSREPADLAGETVTGEILAAMLAANPAYQAALLAAETEPWDGPGIEASAMIEAAGKRRAARRAPRPSQ